MNNSMVETSARISLVLPWPEKLYTEGGCLLLQNCSAKSQVFLDWEKRWLSLGKRVGKWKLSFEIRKIRGFLRIFPTALYIWYLGIPKLEMLCLSVEIFLVVRCFMLWNLNLWIFWNKLFLRVKKKNPSYSIIWMERKPVGVSQEAWGEVGPQERNGRDSWTSETGSKGIALERPDVQGESGASSRAGPLLGFYFSLACAGDNR